jgi:hypothetical protein
MAPDLISTTFELNLPNKRHVLDDSAPTRPGTPSLWFAQKFPDQVKKYGCPFLEIRQSSCDGVSLITPVHINVDFFAAMLGGDERLGHSVVYFEPELCFYYREPILQLYKATSPEKLQTYYRAMILRCLQEMTSDVSKINMFAEFRSDKTAKSVVQRAKSVLAADSSFFSATSKNQRIRGVELHERLARRFVDELLTSEPGQILMLKDAYTTFCLMLKKQELNLLKRSDFKAIVTPLIRDEFNVGFRNDLVVGGSAGIRGWKNVRLQAVPG